MDFTLETYRHLLLTLKKSGYACITFADYCDGQAHRSDGKFAIVRHDVDALPENSLRVAQIEAELGVRASYYFRVVPESNRYEIIQQIAALGHEIGYHYEDMSLCRGDVAHAETHFAEWLRYFRQFYPVRTICMHGAPRSRFDGRALWQTCDYHAFGIVGEPYFDVDFADVFYLTDTGRRWDGYKVSLRDKIPHYQDEWTRRGLVYHTTADIVAAAERGTLPPHIMMTTHPQRWTDNRRAWLTELIGQNLKNCAKRLLVICKSR